MILTSRQAAQATDGKATKPWEVNGVAIDSRTIRPGQLFVAIKGERCDGHDFVAEILQKGAAAAVVSRPEGMPKDAPLLIVKDTLKALWDLGAYQRSKSKAKIIGITGSVGKTSVCQMVKQALSAQAKTCGTTGNFNNHIGLPLTLCNFDPRAEYGVFELGMNHAGELTALAALLKPDVALITGVEAVHLEFFPSEEAIADAKSEIFLGMTAHGIAVLNADNRHFVRLKQNADAAGIENILTFGRMQNAECRLVSTKAHAEKQEVTVECFANTITYALAIPGDHQALNSVAALAGVHALGGDMEKAAGAFKDFKSAKGRGTIYGLTHNGISFTLIDDSYNASPASMRAAFRMLRQQAKGRAIAALGDMRELGKGSPALHAALAEDLREVDLVFTAGILMKHLFSALEPAQRGVHTEEPLALANHIWEMLEPGDTLLVKGSNGSLMWQLAEKLKKEADALSPICAAGE